MGKARFHKGIDNSEIFTESRMIVFVINTIIKVINLTKQDVQCRCMIMCAKINKNPSFVQLM